MCLKSGSKVLRDLGCEPGEIEKNVNREIFPVKGKSF